MSGPAMQGSGDGCYNAGIFYHSGSGVAQSYDLAVGYFRRALAINPNDKEAQADLASAERHRPAGN
ncbi:MAG: SEL1-like repeat protein [Sphingomonadales bacterium]|nr:SEL1-like repeat protein [Sphingomonadales bacterium]